VVLLQLSGFFKKGFGGDGKKFRGPGDVAAQAFELVAFIGFGYDPGVQREAGDTALTNAAIWTHRR
jgi:hypothetical protein